MASKSTKTPAWAVELAARVAAGLPTSTTKTSTAKTAKKAAPAAPAYLARVLASASSLPTDDPIWSACKRRLSALVDSVDNDTTELAAILGVDRRSAQRLRAAYGIERRRVRGEWR